VVVKLVLVLVVVVARAVVEVEVAWTSGVVARRSPCAGGGDPLWEQADSTTPEAPAAMQLPATANPARNVSGVRTVRSFSTSCPGTTPSA
jgi:hypothetical protein